MATDRRAKSTNVLAIVLAFCVLAAAKAEGAARNYVADGDFEREGLAFGSKDGLGTWIPRIHQAPDASVEIVQGQGRNGSACVRYTRASSESRNIHVDQLIEVEPNSIYEVRAWVRSDGRLNPVLAIQTRKWATLAGITTGTSSAWTEVHLAFHSCTHKRVRIEWFPGATGRIHTGVAGTSFLDDVSVTRLQTAPAPLLEAFEISRSRKDDERDLGAIRTAPVGDRLPLRQIVCRDGVLVYEDGTEVALWGVNFQTALSWEWRGRLKPLGVPLEGEALKRITDENLEQLRWLDTGVVRLHLLPADFTDAEGNLRESVFLDVLDYVVHRCGKLGIYVYLTLINEMRVGHFKDSFMAGHEREEWLFNPRFVECSQRYAAALLEHENRYNGRAYKSDPAIAVVEIMNEPRYLDYSSLCSNPKLAAYRQEFLRWCDQQGTRQFPDRVFYTYRYNIVSGFLSRMCTAIRDTGTTKPIVWNLNWPRMINGHEDMFQAVADSPVDGVSFCCYPGQSDVPNPFWAHPTDLSDRNYLPYLRRCYTDYIRLRWLLGRRFAGKAKMAYEFESMYNHTAYLYPAMARLFRSLGAQIAPMWQYTLSPVAEYIGGSHYLNLYCTPKKAVSFRIAAHVFSHTPRHAPYDTAAKEQMGGEGWAVSFPHRLSVLSTPRALMHSSALAWRPFEVHSGVQEIVGCGDSPLVSYAGTGAYFIRVGHDAIDITINPDVKHLRPPWQRVSRRAPMPRLCELDVRTPHRLTLRLVGWDEDVQVDRLEDRRTTPVPLAAEPLSFDAMPGRYRATRRHR